LQLPRIRGNVVRGGFWKMPEELGMGASLGDQASLGCLKNAGCQVEAGRSQMGKESAKIVQVATNAKPIQKAG
jgi:hypothetical protein